jgi:hypothetical protein
VGLLITDCKAPLWRVVLRSGACAAGEILGLMGN